MKKTKAQRIASAVLIASISGGSIMLAPNASAQISLPNINLDSVIDDVRNNVNDFLTNAPALPEINIPEIPAIPNVELPKIELPSIPNINNTEDVINLIEKNTGIKVDRNIIPKDISNVNDLVREIEKQTGTNIDTNNLLANATPQNFDAILKLIEKNSNIKIDPNTIIGTDFTSIDEALKVIEKSTGIVADPNGIIQNFTSIANIDKSVNEVLRSITNSTPVDANKVYNDVTKILNGYKPEDITNPDKVNKAISEVLSAANLSWVNKDVIPEQISPFLSSLFAGNNDQAVAELVPLIQAIASGQSPDNINKALNDAVSSLGIDRMDIPQEAKDSLKQLLLAYTSGKIVNDSSEKTFTAPDGSKITGIFVDPNTKLPKTITTTKTTTTQTTKPTTTQKSSSTTTTQAPKATTTKASPTTTQKTADTVTTTTTVESEKKDEPKLNNIGDVVDAIRAGDISINNGNADELKELLIKLASGTYRENMVATIQNAGLGDLYKLREELAKDREANQELISILDNIIGATAYVSTTIPTVESKPTIVNNTTIVQTTEETPSSDSKDNDESDNTEVDKTIENNVVVDDNEEPTSQNTNTSEENDVIVENEPVRYSSEEDEKTTTTKAPATTVQETTENKADPATENEEELATTGSDMGTLGTLALLSLITAGGAAAALATRRGFLK